MYRRRRVDRLRVGLAFRHGAQQARISVRPRRSRRGRYGRLHLAAPPDRLVARRGPALHGTRGRRRGGRALRLLQPSGRAGEASRGSDRDGGEPGRGPKLRSCDDQDDVVAGVELGLKRVHRGRSPGAGDLHADAGFPARLPRVRCQAEAGVRRELMDTSYLAWPFFNEAHRDQAGELERWTAEVLPSLLEGADGDLDSVYACVGRLVAGLGSAGLLRACVPAAYGGARDQLDVRSLCLAREILAKASGLADFAFAMQGLGSVPITLFGSEEQKRSLLPGVVAGTLIGAFALSEPDAGSDAGAIATRATREGDAWRLDGIK